MSSADSPSYKSLALSSSLTETDSPFRTVLRRALHTGLRQCGVIGLLAGLLYIGLSVFGLGYDLTWTYEGLVRRGVDHQVVAAGILIVAALSAISLILAQLECSLRTGRLFGWTAVLTAAALASFEGAVRSTFSTEYIILIYLLIVAIIPFRPFQVLGIGGSLGIVVYLLGPSGFAWTGEVIPSLAMAKHLAFLGGGSVLVTGASFALYLRHHSFGTTRASLEKHQSLLRRTQEMARVGGWEYNPELDTVRGTDELYEILGLPEGTRFDLDSWIQFFPASSRPTVRDAVEQGLQENEPFELEAPITTATDKERIVQIRGTAESADHSSTRLTGMLHDITEQRALEARLRERERLLRSIVENVSDGIYRFVPDEGIIYANRAFAHLFGYDSVGQVLALDPKELYADPESKAAPLRVHDVQGDADVVFRRKDGTTFVGLLNGTVVRNEEGEIQHVDGVVSDITDLKKRERILKGERDRFETLFETVLQEDRSAPR